METATSSIVSALGAGSGIDMAALAGNLSQAQFALRTERLAGQQDVLERKISAASDLKSQLLQLASALGERVRTGDLAPAPSISNPAVAQVSRSTASRPAGSYTLEVMALAGAQTLSGPAYSAATDAVGSGTLTLRFGTVGAGAFSADAARPQVDIAIASGATLTDVASAINAAQAGVTAYVAQAADGARLVLKGQEGATSGFVMEAAETPGQPGLAALAWHPTTGDAARLLSSASDASFELDGIPMTSAGNTAGEVAPGLSLTLTGTNIGSPAQIRFGDPGPAITSAMQDLTGALNEIVASLGAATDPETGDLARDDGARSLRRQLSTLGSAVIMPGAAAGTPATLAELGLAITRDGTFRLDTARLQATLTRDPEGTAAMFTNGLFGIYATINKIARNAATAGNPGSLAGSVNRYTAQKTRIGAQAAKIAEQQEALRARLSRQFIAADTRISASHSTLSFLQAQVALWNKGGE